MHRGLAARFETLRAPVPASKRLLDQTELVENVLLRLPVRDLILISRTSKRFKSVVECSVRIQRQLFMLPDSPDGKPRCNSFLLDPQRFGKIGVVFQYPSARTDTLPRLRLSFSLPDVADDLRYTSLGLVSAESAHYGSSKVEIRLGKHGKPPVRRNEVHPIEGSWKRMYLMQSGKDIVWVVTEVDMLFSSTNGGCELKGRSEAGLRVGEMFTDEKGTAVVRHGRESPKYGRGVLFSVVKPASYDDW